MLNFIKYAFSIAQFSQILIKEGRKRLLTVSITFFFKRALCFFLFLKKTFYLDFGVGSQKVVAATKRLTPKAMISFNSAVEVTAYPPHHSVIQEGVSVKKIWMSLLLYRQRFLFVFFCMEIFQVLHCHRDMAATVHDNQNKQKSKCSACKPKFLM